MSRSRKIPAPTTAPRAVPQAPAAAGPLLPAAREWSALREPYLVPLLVLIAGRLLAWYQLPWASEDAYITFRYARNLVAGNGLVYNPGERVMGFSSPLWTLWTALGIAVLRDPVTWSRATGLLADVVTLLFATRLLARHAGRAAAWCFAAFFAVWPFFAVVAVSGMENPLMLALIALAAALLERRSAAAGPVLGLLALTRPEGVASAAVMALWAGWRDRLLALVILAGGAAGLWAWFGTPLPQSVLAKSQLYGTPGPWAGRIWWDWIVPMRFGGWPTQGELNMLLPLVVVMAPAAVVGLGVLFRMRRSGVAALAAGTLVVWAGYAALGVAYFFWYFLVPLAGIAVPAAAGLPRLVRGRAIYVSLLLCVLGTWSIARILYVGRAQNEAFDFGRVADYLRAHSRPGDSVMLEPIGFVGYMNPVRVIDEIGLVSPRVAERRMRGAGWYTDVATRERPEWLVVRRGVLERGTAFAGAGAPFRSPVERDSLLARYTLMDPGNEAAGAQALQVLRRAR